MTRRCCVPGCNDDGSTVKHRFPVNENSTFNMWIKRTGNPKLLDLSNSTIYRTYLVCDNHFDEDCKIPGSKKLKQCSLPTLNLPSLLKQAQRKGDTVNCRFNYDIGFIIHDHSYCKIIKTDSSKADLVNVDHENDQKGLMHDHSYSTINKPNSRKNKSANLVDRRNRGVKKRKNVLRILSMSQQNHLTPRTKIVCEALVQMAKAGASVRGKPPRERLMAAYRFSKTKLCQKFVDILG